MNYLDPYEVAIHQLVKYDTRIILDYILMYGEVLDIGSENIPHIDDIDVIFIKGLNLQRGYSHALEQMKTNSEQYICIKYKKNGQQFTLKSFGKISKLEPKTIHYILNFTLLIKLLKQLNSLISLSMDLQSLNE